jgi:hypothetical protein
VVDQSLIDSKINASKRLIDQLHPINAPLLAAYWEWSSDLGRWTLFLVPKSVSDERILVDQAAAKLIETPFRSIFSLSDIVVDSKQIQRARALGQYIRVPRDLGRRIDTTFTGGFYFDGVVVLYVAPEIARQHSVA